MSREELPRGPGGPDEGNEWVDSLRKEGIRAGKGLHSATFTGTLDLMAWLDEFLKELLRILRGETPVPVRAGRGAPRPALPPKKTR